MSITVLSSTIPLRPVRHWWLRSPILLFCAGIALVSRVEMYKKVFFVASMAAWVGSYPQARLTGDRFERTMFIAFVPARVQRWPLDRFVSIQSDSEPQEEFAVGWWFLFGNWWVLWNVLDWMVPWVGGPYKLWLRAASGKRVLAWQGRSDRQFRENLDILQQRLGLPMG